jgi:E1A/CREB-binding protein
MKARYAHKGYPKEFMYRCKCIVMFQNIDGVDVMLFALFTYEHGKDSPPPNQWSLYLSYLDSVHFLEPKEIRTFIFHEILISYLDYARFKGFQRAFIWACPPLADDDYILYAKPKDQLTPTVDHLTKWYLMMLEESQKRNIITEVTNMFDQFFSDASVDASMVPYFEGDYIPGKAEDIIKKLNDKSTKITQNKKIRKLDPSNVISYVGVGNESLKEGMRDPFMQEFCAAILGMKESFIVAFLNCNYVKAQCTSDEREFDFVGSPGRVLDDDAEDINCEFFNTRQAILDLCRANHFQFDELRRAKHTSIMVVSLYHQNRVVQHFCKKGPAFYPCQDRSLDKSTCLRGGNGEIFQDNIAVILHASQCNLPKCRILGCSRAKEYLEHAQTCR